MKSTLNQSYRDFELICINDGSLDKTHQIVTKESTKDHRVKLVRQKNMGVSVARNTGLKIASGEYIMFLDSDDWLAQGALTKLMDVITSNEFDALIWPYIKVYKGGTSVQKIFDENKFFQNKGEIREALHRRLFGPNNYELERPQSLDFLSTVHCKLYKAALINDNNIKFEDIRVVGTSEDTIFNIDFFNIASSAFYINEPLYYHNKSNDLSITSVYKPLLKEKWEKLFFFMRSRIDPHSQLAEDYYKALDNRQALSIIGLGLNEVLSSKSYRLKYYAVKNLLNDKKLQSHVAQLVTKAMPYHWEIFFQVVKRKLTLLVFVQLLIIKFIIKK
jgi:glycosyltransferase EpsH